MWVMMRVGSSMTLGACYFGHRLRGRMFGFVAARRQQWQTSESLSCHGDGSGRHRNVHASARVDDHAFGDAAPGRIFVSVVEHPAGEVRHRYLAWST